MKTLVKLKLNNLEKIGVAEQMAMRGGLSEEIIDGWYIVEVEVVAKKCLILQNLFGIMSILRI